MDAKSKAGSVGPHEVLVTFLQAAMALDRCKEALFLPHGLTAAQFNILNLLGHGGGKMGQAELLERLLVGKATVSIVLSRMEKSGLLRRKKGEADGRRVAVVATAKGLELWRQASPAYGKAVEALTGHWGVVRRKQFCRDLTEFARRIMNTSTRLEGPING
jgi:DNA-binding MarR family transcriptional regulator